MTLKKFILSNQAKHRTIRHLSFWLAYSFYFFIQSIPPQSVEDFFTAKPYYTALINTASFASFYLAVTYLFIYYVYPNTIKREKYWPFVVVFILSYGIGIFINYYMAGIFLRETNYLPDTHDNRLSLSYCNTRWGMIIAIVGTGIKLSKDWYLQQVENTNILKRKNKAEIQLRKSRIHPRLLMRTLDNIHVSVSNHFSNTGSMILKLSDILSYSLYETDDELVLTEKETEAVKNLIALEQLGTKVKENVSIDIAGCTGGSYIVPMTLVKLLEQCIALLHEEENNNYAIRVHVNSEEDKIHMSIDIVSLNKKELPITGLQEILQSSQKRMAAHYQASEYNIQFGKTAYETNILLEVKLINKETAFSKNTNPAYEHA